MSDTQIIWDKIISQLKNINDSPLFSSIIKSIQLIDVVDDKVYLGVPDEFTCEWIKTNYLKVIEKALSETEGHDFDIFISAIPYQDKNIDKKSEELDEHPDNSHGKTEKVGSGSESGTVSGNINPRYTFNEFVSGSTNQFAYSAAEAVAEKPGTSYNPLFIYGGVGLGKTHLINAIGNAILDKNPDKKVCYYTSERFINELITSLRCSKMEDFRRKFRSVDVLLIDDIQFIAGKERTQEEFFHTFNELYEAQRQIVVTSDKFPKEIPGLEERLRSRFEWGLIADIQPLDLETKQAILKLKSEKMGIDLPEDVSLFLAGSSTSNVRDLEGYLNRLNLFSRMKSIPISLKMAQETLKDILSKKNQEVSVEEIQKAVASFYNIKVADLKSSKRIKAFILPRQIAMYLSRKITSCSYPDIGEKFGGKDHSTIIHAINKIEKAIEEDYRLQTAIENIKKSLYA